MALSICSARMINISEYFPITDPTLIFFVVLLIILTAPIIMGRLRIPHIIGLVLAGVVVGEYGLNILDRDASFELFGKVGLYYIMFLAALEMDMDGLRSHVGRHVKFGLLTFVIPFLLTYVVGINLLHYSSSASLVLGCIMSSNTLVAYPIVTRYGLQRKLSVTLSVGGTMIALFLSLLTMAVIVASYDSEGVSWSFWLVFIGKLVAYFVAVIVFIPKLTRWFLRSYSDAVMQFIFVIAMLFMSAALSELAGLEGILGAFIAGLILNRYVPHVSPLMNRIEFTGNALFIPYFLIGVGMLINLRLLFQGHGILWTVLVIVVVGTLGKAMAAYITTFAFRLKRMEGRMIFGLTSAHAAGAIAMVMVGMNTVVAPGRTLVSDDMLNGVVMMILFTCIISSIITERAAQQITLYDMEVPAEQSVDTSRQRILIPMKYPEYAERLVNLALMMRLPGAARELVGLNVVYDDAKADVNRSRGQQLLETMSRHAASADVVMTTQVRLAANIANGIKHAFHETGCTEIIIGMHMHTEVSSRFWGEFHQSLFNGLNRQITMARLQQPLSTIRRVVVAVPSRAQFEPGFYQWLERVLIMVSNMGCQVVFHGRNDTLSLIRAYADNRHSGVRREFIDMEHWNALPQLAATIGQNDLFVIVAARQGTVSYKNALEHLPYEVEHYFSGANLLILFPDQHGDKMNEMTFAQPQHTEEKSAYELIKEWMSKWHKKDNQTN